MSDARYIAIGADIGGTFTDVVVVDERTHAIHSAKVLTTPEHPERAVLAAVDEIMQRAGALPGSIRTLVHGTTLATNAIIERKGARTLLLTTKGFRDALETRTELRYDLYDQNLLSGSSHEKSLEVAEIEAKTSQPFASSALN